MNVTNLILGILDVSLYRYAKEEFWPTETPFPSEDVTASLSWMCGTVWAQVQLDQYVAAWRIKHNQRVRFLHLMRYRSIVAWFVVHPRGGKSDRIFGPPLRDVEE